MGRQALFISMGIAGLGSVIAAVSAFLMPFHKLYFFHASILKGGELTIFVNRAWVDFSVGDLCTWIGGRDAKKMAEGLGGFQSLEKGLEWVIDFCEAPPQYVDLQDVSGRFCNSATELLLKNACEGMQHAYQVGVAVTYVCIVNIVLVVAGIWLYKTYLQTPKPVYRMNGMRVHGAALALLAMSLLLYFGLVSLQLNRIEAAKGFKTVIQLADLNGMAAGYYVMWLAVVLQSVSIVLGTELKLKEEKALVELKEQREMEIELAESHLSSPPPQSNQMMQHGQYSGGPSPGYYGANSMMQQGHYAGGPGYGVYGASGVYLVS